MDAASGCGPAALVEMGEGAVNSVGVEESLAGSESRVSGSGCLSTAVAFVDAAAVGTPGFPSTASTGAWPVFTAAISSGALFFSRGSDGRTGVRGRIELR